MHSQNFSALKAVISNFRKAKVLVVGDLILDEFIWGEVSRISPEAPVPVVWVKNESFMPGGASNVANNIRSLGGNALLCGLVGKDSRGEILRSELKNKGVGVEGIIADAARPTTLKTRVVAHHQQVVRIDKEAVDPVSDRAFARLVAYFTRAIKDADAVIIEDYGKGVITPRLLTKIVPIARRYKKMILVDPKEEHFSYYKGVTVVTPNNHEAARAVGFAIKDDETLIKAGRKLLQKLQCQVALITMGESGMAVFRKGAKVVRIPTVAQEVFDVSGAGDTVIASYALALAAGADPIEAAHIANCAAGIVVGKVGIAVVTPGELTDRIKREFGK
ncbi:MAG: D-glycero-beta-D-manno-heptose-7-phosphate kinase [Candidatus Omnitrophica bacterium]|nr:D-glycero-beta-D-manno-heptose-7-phosphate kinase [Candidatus Omnitrophota bacterium]